MFQTRDTCYWHLKSEIPWKSFHHRFCSQEWYGLHAHTVLQWSQTAVGMWRSVAEWKRHHHHHLLIRCSKLFLLVSIWRDVFSASQKCLFEKRAWHVRLSEQDAASLSSCPEESDVQDLVNFWSLLCLEVELHEPCSYGWWFSELFQPPNYRATNARETVVFLV